MLSIFFVEKVERFAPPSEFTYTYYFPGVPFPYLFEGTQGDVADWNIRYTLNIFSQDVSFTWPLFYAISLLVILVLLIIARALIAAIAANS